MGLHGALGPIRSASAEQRAVGVIGRRGSGKTTEMLVRWRGMLSARPSWVLLYPLAEKLAPAAGTLGGILFGASGLSAPVSLSFLNAMKLERVTFVATVTVFFVTMGLVQIPMLFAYGILDGQRFLLSAAAILPIFAGMPVGAWLARHISRDAFDKIILAVLTLIAVRLFVQAIG